MSEGNSNSNPLLQSSITGGLDILQMYNEALSTDHDQDVMNQGGYGRNRDISAIQSQEFEKGPGFNIGTVGAGIGAGAALGPWGMLAGGVLGAGAELVKMGRQKAAERRFNVEKGNALQDARAVNTSRNYRGRMISNLRQGASNQSKNYNRYL